MRKINKKIKSKYKYDLIFLDIGLPDTTGLELVRKIRHIKKFQTTPIIALTAHDDKDIRKACYDAGFSSFLVKPIDKEQALNIAKKWLYGDQSSKESTEKNKVITKKKIVSKKSGKKSIDLKLGEKLMGGNKKLAMDMLKLLDKFLNKHLQIMKQAFVSEDLEKLRMEVHKLHGAACYCGTPRLKEYAKKLEISIKNGDFPIEKLYRQLCREILSVQKEYSKL
jgi:two-component system sensor histidine kinase BarA